MIKFIFLVNRTDIEWHFEIGMGLQLVELPSLLEKLRDNEPASVKQLCPQPN